MNKLKRFFKELWLDRHSLLEAFAYLITFGWFSYIAGVIYTSNTNILGKVFFTIWSLVLAFLFLLYKCNKDNDQ